MNRHLHFVVASREEYDRIGDRLAPKEGWNALVGGRPGMLTLAMLAERKDAPGIPFRVEVQPSARMKEGVLGVFVQTNEHRTPTTADEEAKTENPTLESLLKILHDDWEVAQNYAEHVASSIVDWATR